LSEVNQLCLWKATGFFHGGGIDPGVFTQACDLRRQKPHFKVSHLVPGNLPQIPNNNPTNPNKFASPNPHNPNINLIMLGNRPDKKPMSNALPKANNKAHIKETTIFFAIIFVPFNCYSTTAGSLIQMEFQPRGNSFRIGHLRTSL
jgi:hypothetical protein